MEIEKKKLKDLRVVDLKNELREKQLDTTGDKNTLVERLKKALQDEGYDPEEFLFDIATTTPKKTPKAANKAKESVVKKDEEEEEKETMDPMETDELIIKDETDEQQDGEFEDVDQVGEIEKEDSRFSEDAEKAEIDEEKDEDADTSKDGKSEDSKDESAKEEKSKEESKQESVQKPEADAMDNSNVDNEDSLNLTIGEEDEQLLRDEESEGNDHKVTESNESNKPTPDKASTDKSDDKKSDKSKEKDEDDGKKDDSKKSDDGEKSKDPKSSARDEKEGASTKPSATTANGKQKITAPSPAKETGKESGATLSRNLWVSGLSSHTRATDLKQIFSKYGKVIGAKVVTNTRTPGTRCYGYVTMATPKDASSCIENLHRTELHGRMISVERAKSDLGSPKANIQTTSLSSSSKTTSEKSSSGSGKDSKDGDTVKRKDTDLLKRAPSKESGGAKDEKKKDEKNGTNTGGAGDKKKDELMKSTSVTSDKKKQDSPKKIDRKSKEVEIHRPIRPERKGPPPFLKRRLGGPPFPRRRSKDREVLSYNKIREERERHRLREKERELREEERRRREIRRRQREEEQRLAREREKLALERERIEKEKAELMRIERERQKLEREKIELERLELKRQQRKIEEAKRAIKRPLSTERHYDEDRKRSTTDRSRGGGGFEAPPPPRFETSIALSRSSQYDRVGTSDSKKRIDDYPSKRDDYSSSKSRDDYKRDSYKRSDDYSKRDIDIPPRHSSSSYDSRAGASGSSRMDTGSSISKDSRYPERSSGSDFRGGSGRDDRDNRNGSNKPRYMDSTSDNRYNDNRSGGGGSNWHNSGPPSVKPFNSMPANSGDIWNNKPSADNSWRMDSSDRYDRTFSERKSNPGSQFMDSSRQQTGWTAGPGMGGSGGGRYPGNSVSSRYENGRF